MILKRTYTFIFILISSLLLLPISADAQKMPMVGGEAKKDSLPIYRGVQVAYNLAGNVFLMASDYGEIEGSVKVSLKNKFFPVFEMGYGMSNHEASNVVNDISVSTNSVFFRVGMDYNIAHSKNNKYRVLLGVRYGFTPFSFHSSAVVEDPVWRNTAEYELHETGLTYHWAEVLLGIDMKLWKFIYLGWSFRYKMPLAENIGDRGNVWYIPGFGRYGYKLGGTFNVGFEF